MYDAATSMAHALPDYNQALTAALRDVQPLLTETVALTDAAGRVLREMIVADRDLPPFNRAQMDGYALRAAEVGQQNTWPIAGEVAAGMSADVDVLPGHCVKIATGAPLPGDVDTVIQHERSDRNDPVSFTIDTIEPGHAVHPRGSDAKQGDVLIEAGTIIRAHHLGIAAMVGCAELNVTQRPRVVILSSGDEIVSVDATPLPHQIRNSNAPMLTELVTRMGGHIVQHQHLKDDRDATIRAVGEALDTADIIITIGGVSAGERDYFPDAFETHGFDERVAGAAIQPGKPIRIGRCNNTQIIALPGNPVSCLACACLFVWPMVRAMTGCNDDMPWRTVELSEAVKPNPRRRAFRPCIIDSNNRATVPSWAGSGDLAHTATTHGLLELPVQDEAVTKGTKLRFLPWPTR